MSKELAKQCASLIKYLTWILKFKYDFSVSDAFQKEALYFYLKSLKNAQENFIGCVKQQYQANADDYNAHKEIDATKLSADKSGQADLSDIKIHFPEDVLQILNYFTRLEEIEHEALERQSDDVREKKYFELLMVSIIISLKVNLDYSPYNYDFLECINKEYYLPYLEAFSEKEYDELYDKAQRITPNRILKDTFKEFKGRLNPFEKAILATKLAMHYDISPGPWLKDLLEEAEFKDYLPYLATKPKKEMATLTQPPKDIDKDLKQSLEGGLQSKRQFRRERLEVESAYKKRQVEMQEEIKQTKGDKSLLKGITDEINQIKQKLTQERCYQLPKINLAYVVLNLSMSITGRDHLNKSVEGKTCTAKPLMKAMAFMFKQDGVQEKLNKITFRKLSQARLNQLERRALSVLNFGTNIHADEQTLQSILINLDKLFNSQAIADPKSDAYVLKQDGLGDDQKKNILHNYTQMGARNILLIQGLAESDEPRVFASLQQKPKKISS